MRLFKNFFKKNTLILIFVLSFVSNLIISGIIGTSIVSPKSVRAESETDRLCVPKSEEYNGLRTSSAFRFTVVNRYRIDITYTPNPNDKCQNKTALDAKYLTEDQQDFAEKVTESLILQQKSLTTNEKVSYYYTIQSEGTDESIIVPKDNTGTVYDNTSGNVGADGWDDLTPIDKIDDYFNNLQYKLTFEEDTMKKSAVDWCGDKNENIFLDGGGDSLSWHCISETVPGPTVNKDNGMSLKNIINKENIDLTYIIADDGSTITPISSGHKSTDYTDGEKDSRYIFSDCSGTMKANSCTDDLVVKSITVAGKTTELKGATIKETLAGVGAGIATLNASVKGKDVTFRAAGPANAAAEASQVAGENTLGTNGQEDNPTCETTGSMLSWVLCPLINFALDGSDWIFKTFIERFLRVSPISANSNHPIFQIWSNFRTIGNIVLLFAMLFVAFGQSIAGGVVDAYTARKVLPRILIAAILLNMSIFIVSIMVDITNVLGGGIGALITSPLKNSGSFNFNFGEGFTWKQNIGILTVLIFIFGISPYHLPGNCKDASRLCGRFFKTRAKDANIDGQAKSPTGPVVLDGDNITADPNDRLIELGATDASNDAATSGTNAANATATDESQSGDNKPIASGDGGGTGQAIMFFIVMPILIAIIGIFVTLVIRNGLLIFLAISSPIAFALYAHPATEKWTKKWFDNFFKALLMYPIVVAIMAIGDVMSTMMFLSSSGIIAKLIACIILFLPMFLIPFAFKFAGSALSTVYGKVSGLGKKGHEYYKGNAQDPQSRRNRARANVSRMLDQKRAKLIGRSATEQKAINEAMGVDGEKGAQTGARRRFSKAQNRLLGLNTRVLGGEDLESRLAHSNEAEAKRIASIHENGPDDTVRAAWAWQDSDGLFWKYQTSKYKEQADGGFIKDKTTGKMIKASDANYDTTGMQRYGINWANNMDRSTVETARRNVFSNHGAMQQALYYEISKAENDEVQSRLVSRFMDLGREMGYSKNDMNGIWKGVTFRHKKLRLDYKHTKVDQDPATGKYKIKMDQAGQLALAREASEKVSKGEFGSQMSSLYATMDTQMEEFSRKPNLDDVDREIIQRYVMTINNLAYGGGGEVGGQQQQEAIRRRMEARQNMTQEELAANGGADGASGGVNYDSMFNTYGSAVSNEAAKRLYLKIRDRYKSEFKTKFNIDFDNFKDLPTGSGIGVASKNPYK